MTEQRADLARRVEELEILTGFQERTLVQLQAEVLAFTRRVTQLEAEVQRLKATRTGDQEPYDEDDRVPSCG